MASSTTYPGKAGSHKNPVERNLKKQSKIMKWTFYLVFLILVWKNRIGVVGLL